MNHRLPKINNAYVAFPQWECCGGIVLQIIRNLTKFTAPGTEVPGVFVFAATAATADLHR